MRRLSGWRPTRAPRAVRSFASQSQAWKGCSGRPSGPICLVCARVTNRRGRLILRSDYAKKGYILILLFYRLVIPVDFPAAAGLSHTGPPFNFLNNTARQVLIVSSARIDGPDSAWRASFGVSIIMPCFLMGIISFNFFDNSFQLKCALSLREHAI